MTTVLTLTIINIAITLKKNHKRICMFWQMFNFCWYNTNAIMIIGCAFVVIYWFAVSKVTVFKILMSYYSDFGGLWSSFFLFRSDDTPQLFSFTISALENQTKEYISNSFQWSGVGGGGLVKSKPQEKWWFFCR